MTTEELLASIEVYQNQLQQIEQALSAANDDEKSQLQELQANLLQLLELTLQQLTKETQNVAEKKTEDRGESAKLKTEEGCNSVALNSADDKFSDEFALFQSEIAALSEDKEEEKKVKEEDSSDEERSDSREANPDGSPPKYSREELEDMVGSQCRSPFTERWGGQTYHNGVVLSLVGDDNGEPDLDDPQVRVLFSQPTSLNMLTCRFFLSDRCKFSNDECRFSHGKIVAASDLKEYRAPDYDSVVSGSRVLVLPEGADVWKGATVEDILEDRSAFSVICDKDKDVMEVRPPQMFPVVCDGDAELDDEERDGDVIERDCESSSEDETFFVPTATWLQNSLSQRLGDWEKHTKGFGSRLMSKMGYIVGTGLGKDGGGIVEPVVAYVYPQGVSLDRCMELREASNGEEMLEVEKRLDREKRKEVAKSIQMAERLRKRTSVFDIINKKLAGGSSGPNNEEDSEEPPKPSLNVSKSVLRTDTTKGLNIKNHQLSENIRLLKKEVNRIEETKQRQSGDKRALSVISARLDEKKIELKKLQEAEKKVQGEQQKRRETKKFCVF